MKTKWYCAKSTGQEVSFEWSHLSIISGERVKFLVKNLIKKITSLVYQDSYYACMCYIRFAFYKEFVPSIYTETTKMCKPVGYLDSMSVCNGVHQGIKIKCWQIRILCLDIHYRWMVIPEKQNGPSSTQVSKASHGEFDYKTRQAFLYCKIILPLYKFLDST